MAAPSGRAGPARAEPLNTVPRMPVVIATRADISLDAVRRVAWAGEDVALAPDALARMERCHASFTAFVQARVAEDPGALIYGTTTAPGDGAAMALTEEAQA